MTKYLILYATLLAAHTCFCQDLKKIDSLTNNLKAIADRKAKAGATAPAMIDSSRANTLYELSKAYWASDLNKATDYANQCLSLSQKIG